MDRKEAEAILRDQQIQRSSDDPRTIEEIAERVQITGSPALDVEASIGSTATLGGKLSIDTAEA